MDNSNFKRPESVLIVIYTVRQQVLLLERVQPPAYWQSVTGSLGWQESAEQAAVRELTEETGLHVNTGEFINRHVTNRFTILPQWRPRYSPEISQNLEHVFTLMLDLPGPIRLNSNEHTRYQWLPAASAAQQVSSKTNRQAIIDYVLTS